MTVAHMPLLASNVLSVATMSLVTFAVADRWVFGSVSTTMRSLHRVRIVAAALVVLTASMASSAHAAELKPVTLQASDATSRPPNHGSIASWRIRTDFWRWISKAARAAQTFAVS